MESLYNNKKGEKMSLKEQYQNLVKKVEAGNFDGVGTLTIISKNCKDCGTEIAYEDDKICDGCTMHQGGWE